jgi:hypothetical protein
VASVFIFYVFKDPQMIGRFLKFLYYVTITCAFCSNLLVVSQTTVLSVLGAGLALRGPDGSMMTATDGLYEERTSVFAVFGIGLASTLGAAVLAVWLILHWEAAFVCFCITIMTCRQVYVNYQRVCKRFDFDENDTVDFNDIFDGPANIHTYKNHKFHRHQVANHARPRSRSFNKKNTPDRHHHHGRHTHDFYNQQYRSRPSSPSEEGSRDEVELMIPRTINNRSGQIQQRRNATGDEYSSARSVESFDSNGDSYPEMHIQTV